MTEIQENQISIEKLPVVVSENNVAKVNVSAEEHELDQIKKQYIKEKRKHVVLKGFRKGAAPEEMVAALFKTEARAVARDNVLYNKYSKLLQDHKLQPLSQPILDRIDDNGQKIDADFTVDVLQPVILGQYLGLEIEKPIPLDSIVALEITLKDIKKAYPKLVDIDIVEGNTSVVADFSVFDGEKELEKQQDFRFIIGHGSYFKPFEDQLIGLKVGQNKKFDILFPENYNKEDFRNKNIHFDVNIKEIRSIIEYANDELAKVLGYEDEAKMLDFCAKQIEAKYNDDKHLYFENQLLNQLLGAHTFNIPRVLIENEIKKLRNERKEFNVDELEEIADRFVRTDLVLHAIYERHPEIHLTQEQFNAKISELAEKAGDSVENTVKKLQEADKLQSYISYISNCRVIDFLIEMSDLKEPGVKNKEENSNG